MKMEWFDKGKSKHFKQKKGEKQACLPYRVVYPLNNSSQYCQKQPM